jgi:hypothetical protein
LHPNCLTTILFKLLLASMKTLTSSEDLLEAASEIPPPHPQQNWRQLKENCKGSIQSLKKPTINQPPKIEK